MIRTLPISTRLVVLALFSSSMSILAAAPAAADPPFDRGDEKIDDQGRFDVELSLTEEAINRVVDDWRGEPSPNVIIGLPRRGFDVGNHNHGLCMAFEWVSVPREDAEQERSEAYETWYSSAYVQERVAEGADPDYRCPIDPAAALPPALIEEQISATISDQLPRPQLELPPGFALPGLRTYLITHHDLDHHTRFDLQLGVLDLAVDVHATGTTTVDWGDGTVTTHDHGSTTGYPDGPINHVYTHAGPVTITATDTWEVTYTAGPITGQIDGVTLAPTTLAIDVTERRAVRTR